MGVADENHTSTDGEAEHAGAVGVMGNHSRCAFKMTRLKDDLGLGEQRVLAQALVRPKPDNLIEVLDGHTTDGSRPILDRQKDHIAAERVEHVMALTPVLRNIGS